MHAATEHKLLTDGLLQEIRERYSFDAVTVQRLQGGYANDVFRLDAAGRTAVLHLKHPPLDQDSINWEHRLLATLSTHLPQALPSLPAVDGSTWFWFRGRPVWIVPWAPGGPAGPADRTAVAGALGRLHAFKADVGTRPNHSRLLRLPLPALQWLPPALEPWRDTLAVARDELTSLVTWLERERRPTTGLTHNDIFGGNVLCEKGVVSAILDWEEADLDWQVWDLASSIRPFCINTDRLDADAVAEFTEAYRAGGGPVPSNEDNLILPLIRAKLILEVLRAPNDRNPRWDYQLANLRTYANLA